MACSLVNFHNFRSCEERLRILYKSSVYRSAVYGFHERCGRNGWFGKNRPSLCSKFGYKHYTASAFPGYNTSVSACNRVWNAEKWLYCSTGNVALLGGQKPCLILLHRKKFCLDSKKLNTGKPQSSQDEWESLLNNDEKKSNISSIPTRKENIFTIPNLLSLSRIIATPYIAYLVLEGHFEFASVLLFIAGVTDILDGKIARRWPSQKSAFGTALDPLGDKILITVLTLALAKAGMLPLLLAGLIVGRDVALILSVFYLRYRTCPPPVTLKRYFDPTLVNTKLNPTAISKVNTALQVAVIWCSMVSPVVGLTDHVALQCFFALAGVTTIWSGLSYVFSKNTVQILKDK